MIEPKKIIRTKRKTLSLQINENGELIVRVPKFVSDSIIQKFIVKNKDWIDRKVNEVINKKSQLKIYTFSDGEEFLFLGKKLKLKFIQLDYLKRKQETSVIISDEYLLIDEKKKGNALKVLEKFYKEEAKKIFVERVNFFLTRLNETFNSNFSPRKIRISNGRRILGSCSSDGNLSFSWRIIQAPLEVIDYVIIHELVHFMERHHKKSFWLKVNRLKPDYKKQIYWLNENWFYYRNFLRH